MSPQIFRTSDFSVHVYRERGGRHHRAHVHIRRFAGGPETVVGLPLLDCIAGPPLSATETAELVERLQALVDEWDDLNG